MVGSRPHVILSAAVSVDGKIATKTGDSKLSSKIDKIRVHKLRSKVFHDQLLRYLFVRVYQH